MNRKLITSGILLGIGLGGFLDGIIFHQILQLHSMLSAKLPQNTVENIKISMIWDGLFHLLTWSCTALAVTLLWNASGENRDSFAGKTYWGAIFLGWGLFNLIEGLINHYLLEVHHVNELSGLSVYDHLFLLSGVIFICIGVLLFVKSKRML